MVLAPLTRVVVAGVVEVVVGLVLKVVVPEIVLTPDDGMVVVTPVFDETLTGWVV